MDHKYKVASGYLVAKTSKDMVKFDNTHNEIKNDYLNAQDVYKILFERDYFYRLVSIEAETTNSEVKIYTNN